VTAACCLANQEDADLSLYDDCEDLAGSEPQSARATAASALAVSCGQQTSRVRTCRKYAPYIWLISNIQEAAENYQPPPWRVTGETAGKIPVVQRGYIYLPFSGKGL